MNHATILMLLIEAGFLLYVVYRAVTVWTGKDWRPGLRR
jgi:hypothetical protein